MRRRRGVLKKGPLLLVHSQPKRHSHMDKVSLKCTQCVTHNVSPTHGQCDTHSHMDNVTLTHSMCHSHMDNVTLTHSMCHSHMDDCTSSICTTRPTQISSRAEARSTQQQMKSMKYATLTCCCCCCCWQWHPGGP